MNSAENFKTVQWALTERCNLSCGHCYMREQGMRARELPWPELNALAEMLAGNGVRNVALTGGEPLCCACFEELAVRLTELGITITRLCTNGTLLDEKTLELLDHLGQRPVVSISYDGDHGAHDALRRCEGAAEAVLAAFDRCRQAGLETASEMTFFSGNADCLWDSICTLHAHGCRSIKILPLVRVGMARDNPVLPVPTSEAFYAWAAEVVEQYFAANEPVELTLYGAFAAVPHMGWTIPFIRFDGRQTPGSCRVCDEARMRPYLSAGGKLFPCSAMAGVRDAQEDFPYVPDTGLLNALRAPALCRFTEHTLAEHIKHNVRCAQCCFVSMCGGGCRAIPLLSGGKFTDENADCCAFFEGGWYRRIMESARKGKLLAALW